MNQMINTNCHNSYEEFPFEKVSTSQINLKKHHAVIQIFRKQELLAPKLLELFNACIFLIIQVQLQVGTGWSLPAGEQRASVLFRYDSTSARKFCRRS